MGLNAKTERERDQERHVCTLTHSCSAHLLRGGGFSSPRVCGTGSSGLLLKILRKIKINREGKSQLTLSVGGGEEGVTQCITSYLAPFGARL